MPALASVKTDSAGGIGMADLRLGKALASAMSDTSNAFEGADLQKLCPSDSKWCPYGGEGGGAGVSNLPGSQGLALAIWG